MLNGVCCRKLGKPIASLKAFQLEIIDRELLVGTLHNTEVDWNH